MEVLSEEQALQAVLGREDFGIDNEGLDFQQLEEYITGEAMCLPEDAIPAVAYGRPQGTVSHSDLKLNVRLHSQPLSQVPPQVPQTMYMPTPTPRMNFDPPHHYKHTPLPDSPPDSGSEPYSPPDGNHHNHQDGYHLNPDKQQSLVNSVNSLHGAMYPHHRPPVSMSSKVPPGGYMPEPPKLNHLPTTQPTSLPLPHQHSHQMTPPLNHPVLPPHFGSNMNNLQTHQTKKRKYSDSPNNTINGNILNSMNSVINIKQEPPALDPPDLFIRSSCSLSGNSFPTYGIPDCSGDDDYSYDIDGNGSFMDSSYQVIKWQSYNPTKWNILTDGDLKDLPSINYRVDADKGFNFSVPDEAFVCQKKNHFQVTVHIGISGDAKYVRTPDGVKKIESFFIHFHGIKMESPSQMIKIEQSQSDRSKKSFYPVKVDLTPDQVTKVTVGRLHFSETTSNNMRKKGKPNPDQRYFMLVVSLHAHSGDNNYMIAGSNSERIIVRASNPGQFDSDVDVLWSKGHTQDSVYHVGRVGINTDHPEEALTVHGNMKVTGHVMQPSDIRAKEKLEELNTKVSLENVAKIRLYKYQYSEDYAETAGIPEDGRDDTGVIAQEMLEVLPDAVQQTGDILLPNGQRIENFLHVKKDRIFMENVGAVKELCKLTDNLENRIDELEKMNKKLTKLKRYDSLKSNVSSKSGSSVSTVSSSQPKKHHSHHSHHKSQDKSSGSRCPRGQNSGLCSNRFIQFTIIILVLIMAFCLIAITTLYILEKGKATTPNLQHSEPNKFTSSEGVATLNRSMPTTTPIPRHRSTNHRPVFPRSSTGPPTTTPHARPKIIPPYPVCTSNCEQVCCPAPSEDQPEPNVQPNVVGTYSNTFKQSEKEDRNSHIHSETTTRRISALNTIIIDSPIQSQPAPNVINNNNGKGYHIVNKDNIHVVGYRYKRNTVNPELDVEIMIKELNFTIGNEYCFGSCSGQNLSYKAKLSPYFGAQPITLQFRTRTAAKVSLCSNSTFGQCHGLPSVETPSAAGSEYTTLSEFKLAIGQHYRTTYKFRITQNRSQQNFCSIPASEQGNSFYEYNIIFERTCLDDEQE